MGETLQRVTPSFNRSLRIESRTDRLTGDPGAVVLREILERSGILGWMTARLKDPRSQVDVMRPAGPTTGLARHGRKTGKAGRLLVVQHAELGHLDQDGHRGDRSDARDGAENIPATKQPRVGVNQARYGAVDLFHLYPDQFETDPQLALDHGVHGGLFAVGRGDAVLDQGLPGHAQLSEIMQSFRFRRPPFKVENRAHLREDRRIDPIGLGQFSGCFREAARGTRVDLDRLDARCDQRCLEEPVIWPGGFEHDAHGCFADPADHPRAPGPIIWKLPVFAFA